LREKRVDSWRNFANKKSIVGTRSSNKSIKPPVIKMEERNNLNSKGDVGVDRKPMGL